MLRSRFGTTKAGLAGLCIAVVIISGCANVGQQGATVDSAAASAVPAAGANPPVTATAAQAPPDDAAAAVPRTTTVTRTVHYRVRRGDTLASVAQKNDCSVKDLLAWNGMKSSSRIKKGQVLRIVTQETVTTTAAAAAPGATSSVSAADARQMAAQSRRPAKSVALAWPAQGTVVEPFQAGETRGIEIAGNAGDPVLAAADGKVMYAGTGLNEYGSLIIVQHNKDFLTAYSHNRKLLVKTGDVVHQGQQIAEMGSENNTRVSVLFELRHDGKPIDPMPYLPHGHG
jgi:lipoprotein NlpD